MSDNTTKNQDSTKKGKTLPVMFLILGLILIALAWGLSHPAAVYGLLHPKTAEHVAATQEEKAPAPEGQAAQAPGTEAAPIVIDHTPPQKVAPKPQIEAVGNTIGDPKAPVHIVEYSSLTCGHCANFHETTLDALRVKYVDTGKVFFEFRDFPLNRPALDATMILNCLPKDQYFGFMSMLFQTQDHWAYTEDYLVPLRQNARLAGMSNEAFDACLADKAKQDALLKDMQDAAKTYDLNATPTFIINDGAKKIVGGQPLAAFSDIIDPLLTQKDQHPAAPQPASSPEATPDAATAPATQGQ